MGGGQSRSRLLAQRPGSKTSGVAMPCDSTRTGYSHASFASYRAPELTSPDDLSTFPVAAASVRDSSAALFERHSMGRASASRDYGGRLTTVQLAELWGDEDGSECSADESSRVDADQSSLLMKLTPRANSTTIPAIERQGSSLCNTPKSPASCVASIKEEVAKVDEDVREVVSDSEDTTGAPELRVPAISDAEPTGAWTPGCDATSHPCDTASHSCETASHTEQFASAVAPQRHMERSAEMGSECEDVSSSLPLSPHVVRAEPAQP